MSEETKDFNEFEMALREGFDAEDAKVGDIVQGTIAAIHGDVALIDISGKSEAVLDRTELDEQGTGDPIEVVVVSVGEEVKVSHRLVLERRLKDKLHEAVASGEAVEGKVVGRRKGGFDVTLGGVRGFCPISHIDEIRSEEVDHHLGQTYNFKILEYEPESHKLVVSRAVLQREEKAKKREEAWAKLTAGEVVTGKVRSLTDFGAFVDLGGVDGLVHVTEISHARVKQPKDVLTMGQEVEVKILDMDQEKNRISLSMKQLQDDPWDKVEESFPKGGAFEGRIVRKAAFGVFVELIPGLDGLLHVSQLPPGVELNAPEFAESEMVRGWIKDVDTGNQRIGLTMRRVPDRDPWERIEMRYQEGQTIEGVVENGADFGVFVELEAGLSALIPVSELGVERDIDPKTVYNPGDTVKAKVMSIDGGRRRISLSIKSYVKDKERSEYMNHMETGDDSSAITGFGSQLMNALGKKK